MFTEYQMINSFENGLKEPTDINFSITEKRDWNKLSANQHAFDTYYNSMSASCGVIKSLVYPPSSRVTLESMT